MGALRFLLAVSVVIEHSGPILGHEMVDGITAVQIFFIISGFYMALILKEKYNKKGSFKLFLSNRLIRIYPAYFTVFALTFLFATLKFITAGGGILNNFWQALFYINPYSLALIILSNIFLFGQDMITFMALSSPEILFFSNEFGAFDPTPWNFFIVPQAWTLGAELTFYLLAPFLTKLKNKHLMFILGLSLLARLCAITQDLDFDPWSYRFFPFELAFFIAGILSYRIYEKIAKAETDLTLLLKVIFLITIIFIFMFQLIPWNNEIKYWGFCILFFMSIPFIFLLTKNSKIDRAIGELSYPIYISHMFIVIYFMPIFENNFMAIGYFINKETGLFALLATLFFSVFIMIVNAPLERYRQKRVSHYAQAAQIYPQNT